MNVTTLDIDPQIFWGIVSMGGFALACLLVVGLMASAKGDKPDPIKVMKASFGLKKVNAGVFLIALLLWGAVFVLLTLGLIWLIWGLIWQGFPVGDEGIWNWRFGLAKLTALVATLGAVVALPVTLQRLRLTRQQNDLSGEALITDRISKAVDQLGNENSAVRMGAIHSLERIMVDSENDRVMVMRTLNAYLKYRQSRRPPDDPAIIPEVEVDMQTALEVILRWNAE